MTLYWYQIRAKDGVDQAYTYVGCSNVSPEELLKKIEQGEPVRLDELLYMDRGEVKEWGDWDRAITPSVFIPPKYIHAFKVFRGDPRVTPR